MDISIIIVNYNSRHLLFNCVKSILSNIINVEYEVIIIDNNSSDNSLDLCKSLTSEKLIIVEPKENLGFAKANNLGVKHSSGKVLHFLNPDTEVDENLVNDYNNIVRNVSNGIEKIYVNPMKNLDGTVNYGQNYIPDAFNYLTYLFNRKKTKWYYLGATVIISRRTFEFIGGWNEDIFMYAEDADIFFRINKYHIPIEELKTIIFHYGGGSSKNTFSNMERELLIQKSLRVYYKSNRIGALNYILFQILMVLSFIRKPKRAWWQICAIIKSFY